MDSQLYTYKCACFVDGEEIHRAGIISATSYGAAAELIEEYFGSELGLITHLCALATQIFCLPSTEQKDLEEDLVDLVEAEVF